MKKIVLILILLFTTSSVKATTDFDFSLPFNDHGSIMLLIDPDTGVILYANDEAVNFYGYERTLLQGMKISNINQLSESEIADEISLAVSEEREYFLFEHKLMDGTVKSVEVYSSPYVYNGKTYLFSIIYDITDKKILENNIRIRRAHIYALLLIGLLLQILVIYRLKLSSKKNKELKEKLEHDMKYDKLSGLLNRVTFEIGFKEMFVKEKLPIIFSILDVNNLKLLNDTFGHSAGDQLIYQVSREIVSVVPENSLVYRISGDEFVVIASIKDDKQFNELNEQLKSVEVVIEGLNMTVSSGSVYVDNLKSNFLSIFKKAEDIMYSTKLESKVKNGEETIHTISNVLMEKCPITELHSQRVSKYAVEIGKEMDLSSDELLILRRAGLLHDIGLITIDTSVLQKPDKLTTFEYSEVKKHAEKGFNILKNIKGFETIAEVVLHHHEHYNGEGYPVSIAGDDIPLLSRILNVADAFDSMTSTKPYREILTQQEAIEEILANKGSQFDPDVVDALLACSLNNEM